MDSPSSSASLRRLRDLNTDDLLQATALSRAAELCPPLRRLFDGPSLVLARRLVALDAAVRRGQGPEAALALLTSWGVRVGPTGPSVVLQGPRLFVANHPGLGDFLALLSQIGTPDLKVVARDRPFLRALPGIAERLFLLPERGAVTVLRQVQKHLSAGGAVLTFPAGRIEPDPAWTDPDPQWAAWSSSTKLWSRTVPGLSIQPLLVAGVRHPAFLDPWFARWRRPQDRDWTAAVAQLVLQVLWSRPRRQRIEVARGPVLTRPEDLSEALGQLARRVRRPNS